MRDIQKEVIIGDDVYIIRRFNVLDGMVMAKFVMEKILPLWTALSGEEPPKKDTTKKTSRSKKPETTNKQAAQAPELDMSDTQFLSTITAALTSITDAELKKLMTDCLNYADKKMPAGPAHVMYGNRFEVADLEYDLGTCLTLCIHVLSYNFADFFGESGSNSILDRLNTQLPTL